MASSPEWRVAALGGARVLFVMAVGQEYGPKLAARFRPLFTGVGPIEAALGTGVALASLGDALPDLVVSLGSAGSRRCALGTVRQVSAVSWRDMDATRLGFARGVMPFLDRPAAERLATPLSLPLATLATGATIVGGDDYDRVDADLVDMETYAVVRACQRFGVPVIGLRGVSDGPGELAGIEDWTALLAHLDVALAGVVDELAGVLAISSLPFVLSRDGAERRAVSKDSPRPVLRYATSLRSAACMLDVAPWCCHDGAIAGGMAIPPGDRAEGTDHGLVRGTVE